MAIRIVTEERKKDLTPPEWQDAVGPFDAAQTAAAVDKANNMPGAEVDAAMVQVPFPVLVMPITAAALDFGSAQVTTVRLGDLIASQTWVRRDRLVAHIEAGGRRAPANALTTLPLVAEGGIILDGHHTCTALFLLAGPDIKFPVWQLPIGIATGHPR